MKKNKYSTNAGFMDCKSTGRAITLKALEKAYKQAKKYNDAQNIFWFTYSELFPEPKYSLWQRIKTAVRYILNK